MKITLYQTAESLDPSAITENPSASLAGYVKEVTEALKQSFDCEIDHVEQDNTHSWKLTDLTIEQEINRDEIEREIQDITETVFQVGNFWQ